MNSISKLSVLAVSTLAILVSLSTAQARARGGANGGGGTSCTKAGINNGRPVLLDLAIAFPGIQEPAGEKAQVTPVANLIGFDLFKYRATEAYKFAVTRVQEWERVMPELAILEDTMANLQMVVTPFRSLEVSRAAIDSNSICQESDLNPVIFYVNGRAHVSISGWNSLGLYSQAGAIIHESLRQQQLLHNQEINDATLQYITAKLVLSAPARDERISGSGLFAKFDEVDSRILNELGKACKALGRANASQSMKLKSALTPVRNELVPLCKNQQPVDQERMTHVQELLNEAFRSVGAVDDMQAILPISNAVSSTLQHFLVRGMEQNTSGLVNASNALNAGTDDFALTLLAKAYLDGSIKPGKRDEATAFIASQRLEYQRLIEQGVLK